MRKYLYLIIFACLFFSKTSAQISGTSYAEAKNTKKANWAFTYTETPSFSSKQADGSIQGLAVELMEKFAEFVEREEGIKVTYEFKAKDPEDFNGFLQEVKSGKGGVFGLGNITITEARKKDYHFSPSFIKNVAILCTHKDVPTLESMEKAATAFSGFNAIAVKGTTNEMVVLDMMKKHVPNAVVQKVESNSAAVDAIVKDKKAFTNMDFTFYLYALQQNLPIKRHPVGDQSTEEFGVIMPKSNDWVPLMNKFMTSEYFASSDYRRMLSKHLGANALKLLDSFEKR